MKREPMWRRYLRLRGADPAADVADELEFHLAMLKEELVRAGYPEEEAARRARAQFGDARRAREECVRIDRGELRRARRVEWLGGLRQDVGYALRGLARSPGFAVVAVLTLALGIGANAAIFSVVDGVLLKPFPYPEAERIVTLWQSDRAAGVERDEVAAANVADWRERVTSFSAMAAVEPYGLDYRGPDGPVTLDTWLVSEDFFAVMGAPALYGRTLGAEDFERTGSVHESGVPALVLSHRLWRERFGGDPEVVGRVVVVDERPATVVGVMAPDFQYPTGSAVWAPAPLASIGGGSRAANYLQAVGRLAPGATAEQAAAELDAVARQLAVEHPRTNERVGVALVPLTEHLLGGVRPALLLLLGAVGLVLLIACANVASLLLARGARRQREFAVRAAIGAGRGRLLQQTLTESLLLALLGGACGVLLAYWSTGLIVRAAPADLPRVEAIGVDPRVLLFALGASVVTALLFGVFPGLSMTRPALTDALGAGGRGSTSGRGHRRLREGLVVGEIALAIVLLAGAALVVRSFAALTAVDRGFRTENVLAVTVQAWSYYPAPAQRAAFVADAVERMEALPGVEAVGVTSSLPLASAIGAHEAEFTVRGRPATAGEEATAHASLITNGYLDALGIPLRRGRLFQGTDAPGAPFVVLISEELARRHFADEDPLGRLITLRFAGPPVEAEVVGVVGDVRQSGLDVPPEPAIYAHYPQARTGAIAFTLRTAVPPLSLVEAVQGVIWESNAAMPIADVATLDGLMTESLRERRFSLLLLGGFSVLALLLATVGVYGLLSYAMRERTREIGVRMALGARPGDILRWLVGEGARLTAVGLLLGGIATLLLTRLLRSLLYEVEPTDPVAIVSAILIMGGTALLASYLPAQGATRVDPVTALRAEQ